MTSYQLIPKCTVNDAATLAENNMSAFWPLTWWNIMWVNRTLDSLIAAAAMRLPDRLLAGREVRRHQMVVDPTTGSAVGYARWILPESHADQWLEAQTPNVSDEESKRYRESFAQADFTTRKDMDSIDDPVHAMMEKHAPKKPHIKLDFLCANPAHQRRGIAGMLVKSGIEQADKLGLDIFLVAMGGNALGMYKQHGFEQLDGLVQDLKPWGAEGVYETYILVKHPSM